MANEGFRDLGLALTGGDIDREGARLEGLATGTNIQAKRASTQNALAQARLRVDEAKARENLADELEVGGNRALAATIRAGGNPEQVTGAQLDQQEQGFRGTLADIAVPFEQRQAAAQAIEGKVVDPFQIEGGLFADVFNPGDAPRVAPESALDSDATRALAEQRRAAAQLSDERRLHPDRFKASARADGAPTVGLAETLLPGGKGTSIIPEDINAEEAFGAEAFLKGGLNAVSDFIGQGTPFEDEAQANEVMGNLGVRTQIVMQARVPGRPSAFLLNLLGTYAENPRELFRGDAKAKTRLRNTVATLRQDLQRTKDALNAPTKKTPTRMGELTDAQFALADLVADYETILNSLETPGVAIDSGAAGGDLSSIAVGESITQNGVTITRKN